MTTSDSEPGIGTASRPIVVLLIDDQRFVYVAVRHLLASEPDIELYYCEDARDAVAHANRIAPTVILQDLVMPDIDGLTLVDPFRRNPVTANTPIIVLSDHEDESTRAQAKTAGADDYLVKWPDRQTLGACLRHHAHRQAVATPGMRRLRPPTSTVRQTTRQSTGPDGRRCRAAHSTTSVMSRRSTLRSDVRQPSSRLAQSGAVADIVRSFWRERESVPVTESQLAQDSSRNYPRLRQNVRMSNVLRQAR